MWNFDGRQKNAGRRCSRNSEAPGPRVVSALGFIKLLLDWKSSAEEAVTTAHQIHGMVGALLPMVKSPWFGIALIGIGLTYAFFVPNEIHPSVGLKVANGIAWIGCALCAVLLWSVFSVRFIDQQVRPVEAQDEYNWGPLTQSGEEQTDKAFKEFGKHEVVILRCEQTDCQVLADSFKKFVKDHPTPRVWPGFDIPGITIYFTLIPRELSPQRLSVYKQASLRSLVVMSIACRRSPVRFWHCALNWP